jgi:glucose-6-phosphate isomerase
LDGAYMMDKHFFDAPLDKNMPVLMALIGIWNINFLNYNTLALLPYETRLTRFADFIQQLEMESNGKSVTINGSPIDYKTCPVIFGGVGTNSQHSFFQLLHQGSDKTPCDFIGVKKSIDGFEKQHILLLSNMLAQSQAMMQGQENKSDTHKNFDGNIPSTTILLDQLDAYTLGMILALYEHKTFVQGVIWDLNSFDQFGVELGKALSKKIENAELDGADCSTKALYKLINS